MKAPVDMVLLRVKEQENLHNCVCVEVSELELWLEEQQTGLESQDCGRSEEATEALLRKLDSVDVELDNHRRTVDKLQASGVLLQHLEHPNR